MSRKVFISILGTGDYTPCCYKLNETTSREVKFVQSALTDFVCADWTSNDKIFICATKEASNTHWETLPKELHVNATKVDIPTGENTGEIWGQFQNIYNVLQNDDELTVDITHGLRSIPLLVSALLQYAKFLKGVKVNAIYY
jgi:CRISPR-associated DxTHG motif protein